MSNSPSNKRKFKLKHDVVTVKYYQYYKAWYVF